MSSNATSRREAWLVFVGMLAATAWYAWPQVGFALQALRLLADGILRAGNP
jgi:hypothetical protein